LETIRRSIRDGIDRARDRVTRNKKTARMA
jgi:hypothetical protein